MPSQEQEGRRGVTTLLVTDTDYLRSILLESISALALDLHHEAETPRSVPSIGRRQIGAREAARIQDVLRRLDLTREMLGQLGWTKREGATLNG
jgi:hypothetical protein